MSPHILSSACTRGSYCYLKGHRHNSQQVNIEKGWVRVLQCLSMQHPSENLRLWDSRFLSLSSLVDRSSLGAQNLVSVFPCERMEKVGQRYIQVERLGVTLMSYRREGGTFDCTLSPRIAAFEKSRTKLNMTDSHTVFMETQRDNYHFSNCAPTHKHTVTNCIELSKLLRAACLFLSRPDCYPQRQRRLVEGTRESKIKTA